MPFLTAGDPDLAATASLLEAAQDAGASVCEVGIPFSDPVADGPVIQASMTHALACGVRPVQVFEMIASVRPKLHIGVVVMVSYSIVHRIGASRFIRDAAEAGVDGLIFPDLPLEAYVASGLDQMAAESGLTCSLLISPTTPPDRAQAIAKACTGFVYLLSRSGITGEKPSLPQDLSLRVESLRQATSLPIAVGFGVSDASQVRQVVEVADAAIVGSAIMRRVAQHRCERSDVVVDQVRRDLHELASGLDLDNPCLG